MQMSDYLQERGDTRGVSRVALRRVEHLYYKTDAVYDAMRRMAMAQQESHAAGEAPVENGVETKTEEEGADLGEEDEPVDEAAVCVNDSATLHLNIICCGGVIVLLLWVGIAWSIRAFDLTCPHAGHFTYRPMLTAFPRHVVPMIHSVARYISQQPSY